MPLNFVLGQKGKELLSVGGYLYSFSRKNKDNYVWKCSNVRDCSGKAYTTTNNREGEQLTIYVCSIC